MISLWIIVAYILNNGQVKICILNQRRFNFNAYFFSGGFTWRYAWRRKTYYRCSNVIWLCLQWNIALFFHSTCNCQHYWFHLVQFHMGKNITSALSLAEMSFNKINQMYVVSRMKFRVWLFKYCHSSDAPKSPWQTWRTWHPVHVQAPTIALI